VSKETASASKKLGRDDAVRLVRAAWTIIVAKGNNVLRFDMRTNPPDEATLLSHLLGPTGNLRAPTIVNGTVLLVGFNEEAYDTSLARS